MDSTPPITPIILAGGSGTRLHPYSTPEYPKQFLPILGGLSLLQHTAQRVEGAEFTSPIIVTNRLYSKLVKEHLAAIDITPQAIILEPSSRNTAPAIALTLALMQQQGQSDSLTLILPSDHIIEDQTEFKATLQEAAKAAETAPIITLGVTPTSPETRFGYIHRGEKQENGYHVTRFVEKPDTDTAQAYYQSGEYFWNSGIFIMRCSEGIAAYNQHAQDISTAAKQSIQHADITANIIRPESSAFNTSPSIAFDYAVLEHMTNLTVIPLNAGWNDIGTVESYENHYLKQTG